MSRPFLYLVSATAASCASTPSAPPPGPSSDAAPPSYERLVAAAREQAERGRSERALELVERAVVAGPERPEAYLVYGLALAQTGKLDESAAKYEMARKRGSRSRRLYVELASVYDVAQRYQDAVRVYRDYLDMRPNDAEMRQELGLTLLLLKQFDRAVAELTTALAAADPANTQIKLDLGYALLQAGRPEDAAAMFIDVVEADPKRHDVKLLLARARAAQGNAAEAITLLDHVIAAEASEPALRMRARLHLLTGEVGAAASDYERLLKAKPGDPALLLGFAGVLIALGQLDQAEQLLGRVRSSIKEHPVLAFRSAQISWRRGERPALKTLAGFARDSPTDVEAWRELHAAAKRFKDRKLRRESAARLRALGDL